MPDAYEHGLVPTVFKPFARDLALRAAQLQPARILEIAAGTGVLSEQLLKTVPAARLVATDLNDAMVRVGERRAPGAVWQTADAMALPFDDSTFDLVACQFGLMFFPGKPAAMTEVRRVLVPGGSCLFNVWGPLESHDFEAAITAACDRLYPSDPPRFLRSVPHYYASIDDLVVDIRAGGLDVVDQETIVLESPDASPADVAAAYCSGTPLRFEIIARGGDLDAAADAIAAEIADRLGGAASVRGRMQAYVVRGRSATPKHRPKA